MKTDQIRFSDVISSEQIMDFDQTCTRALLGGGSELIRFW